MHFRTCLPLYKCIKHFKEVDKTKLIGTQLVYIKFSSEAFITPLGLLKLEL